ncbi:histidine phosphatase family protein [Aliiroseovarius sp. M344]|uniref:SixA phosphatase family protein n=1 Tax=Aliiroseovarius sp. M344 TaxID=2867010 RepID=UPI0021ADC737|nr:phosphoglycerate mutase family protein [Aliiroseovarius sp. M344]UWQ14779.1 histidine phosphatase family protein [Aliiroseovarius sp. M344]
MRMFYAGLLLFFSTGSPAEAQDAVYLIRHGEKELSGADPALTPEGRKRAAAWAVLLRNVGLDVIITSDALRTQQTGGIIADALSLQTSALPKGDVAGLVDTLEFGHSEGTALIVAHAETIPRILEHLGVFEAVTIKQTEFANLYVVLEPTSDDPKFIHLLMP